MAESSLEPLVPAQAKLIADEMRKKGRELTACGIVVLSVIGESRGKRVLHAYVKEAAETDGYHPKTIKKCLLKLMEKGVIEGDKNPVLGTSWRYVRKEDRGKEKPLTPEQERREREVDELEREIEEFRKVSARADRDKVKWTWGPQDSYVEWDEWLPRKQEWRKHKYFFHPETGECDCGYRRNNDGFCKHEIERDRRRERRAERRKERRAGERAAKD